MLVDEAVGAWATRHIAGEAELVHDRTRGGADEGSSLAEVGNPPLLEAAGQGHEYVSRGLGVGERAMAGRDRGAEGVGHGAQTVVGKAGREEPGQRESVDGPFAQPPAL